MRLVVVLLSVLLVLSIALNAYLYGVITLDELGIEQQTVSSQKSAIETPRTLPPIVNAPSPMELAFSDLDFTTVLALYETQLQASPAEAAENKLRWFERILSAIANAEDKQTDHPYGEFITTFLKAYPYDREFLYLEVLTSDQRENPAEFLGALYVLLQDELNEDLAGLVGGKIREEFDLMVTQLTDLSAWDILASSLETLQVYAPNERRILVNLANAYAQLGQYSLMESTLAYLPQQDKEAQRLRDFRDNQLARETVEKTETDGIPLNQIGDHFIVSALLQDEFQLNLLIDTGASTTVISSHIYSRLRRSLDSEFLGRYRINTAGGQVRAPVYRFKNLEIGGHRVNDIAIVVMRMDDFQADGLLGMNFLRKFRFLLDQESSELHLFERG